VVVVVREVQNVQACEITKMNAKLKKKKVESEDLVVAGRKI